MKCEVEHSPSFNHYSYLTHFVLGDSPIIAASIGRHEFTIDNFHLHYSGAEFTIFGAGINWSYSRHLLVQENEGSTKCLILLGHHGGISVANLVG